MKPVARTQSKRNGISYHGTPPKGQGVTEGLGFETRRRLVEGVPIHRAPHMRSMGTVRNLGVEDAALIVEAIVGGFTMQYVVLIPEEPRWRFVPT